MQYNAENFFDLVFDKKTEDYTYLPLEVKKTVPGHTEFCNTIRSPYYQNECLTLDYNQNIFDKKIAAIKKVLQAFDSSKKGPDILVLQEIENVKVLEKIMKEAMPGNKYFMALIEGDDSRGIDVGVISKYPILSKVRHPLVISGQRVNTRGITEVNISVQGKKVIVFANHWPSQGSPAQLRAASAKLLTKIAKRKKADLILAVGDFNTLPTDVPYPFNDLPDFIDSETEARKVNLKLHPGTHFYNRTWNSLDRIFVHKNSTLGPDYKSFQIMNHPFLMGIDSYSNLPAPKRFNMRTGEGHSDHLPITLNIPI